MGRIRHRSVYDEADPADRGHRLLVTRYWPRGVRREAVDSWERALGAPRELIRRKKEGTLDWGELRRLYVADLDRSALRRPRELAREGDVTLLCTCRDDLCHRRVLAGMLARAARGNTSGRSPVRKK